MTVGDDQVQGLRQLQHQATRLSRRLRSAATAGGVAFTGTDSTGAVAATLSVDGQPPQVRLSADWRTMVAQHALGAAVVAALSNATTARLTGWAAGLTSEPEPRDPGDEPVALAHAEPGDPASRQSAYALRDMLELLEDVDTQMAAGIEAAEAAATRTRTAANPRQTVRITATADMVTSVDFDSGWLRSADHDRIAAAITDALAALRHLTAADHERALQSLPAIDRLRRLTATPESLWREAGLIR